MQKSYDLMVLDHRIVTLLVDRGECSVSIRLLTEMPNCDELTVTGVVDQGSESVVFSYDY